MSTFTLRYNVLSHSANADKANRLAKKLGGVTENAGRTMVVSRDSMEKNFVKLLDLVVGSIKGAEILLDDDEIESPSLLKAIAGCERVRYCDEECQFFAGLWQRVLRAVGIKDDNEVWEVTEGTFNVMDSEDLIVSSDSGGFRVDRGALLRDFDRYFALHYAICPKFDVSRHRSAIASLPPEIAVKRVEYSVVRQMEAKKLEHAAVEGEEEALRKIGDEFEKRLRRVLDDYFERKPRI